MCCIGCFHVTLAKISDRTKARGGLSDSVSVHCCSVCLARTSCRWKCMLDTPHIMVNPRTEVGGGNQRSSPSDLFSPDRPCLLKVP